MHSADVVVAWGDDVLFVARVRNELVVGDEGIVDFAVARETLGVARLRLVRVEDEVIVTVPRAAHVELSSLATATAFRHHVPLSSTDHEEWGELVLPKGARVSFRCGALSFHVTLVTEGEDVALPRGGGRRDVTTKLSIAASLSVHLALLGALSAVPSASLDVEQAAIDHETLAYLQQKNLRTTQVPTPTIPRTRGDSADDTGAGKKHFGEQGMIGATTNAGGGRYMIKGPPDSIEAQLSRARALIEGGHYGALAAFGTAKAPRDFAGGLDSFGRDPNDFDGLMRADDDGDALGFAGLGLYGSGHGGGGDTVGVGLGHVGDYGHGVGRFANGNGSGSGMGWAGGGGRVGLRRSTVIRCRLFVEIETTPHLPAEVVRRIVRANHPRFRACYESGLKRDPSLRGTVSVRFIIDRVGAVETTSVDGGTLVDREVSACTRSVFESMSFPAPESGKVMVTYPIDYDVE